MSRWVILGAGFDAVGAPTLVEIELATAARQRSRSRLMLGPAPAQSESSPPATTCRILPHPCLQPWRCPWPMTRYFMVFRRRPTDFDQPRRLRVSDARHRHCLSDDGVKWEGCRKGPCSAASRTRNFCPTTHVWAPIGARTSDVLRRYAPRDACRHCPTPPTSSIRSSLAALPELRNVWCGPGDHRRSLPRLERTVPDLLTTYAPLGQVARSTT